MLPLRADDPDRIADYRLIGRLGEGGMGVVYLARSPRGRMAAVKTVRADLAAAADFRHRFARETAAAQRVGGEWTAPVLAADPDAELPWVATAYIAGPTLHEVVTQWHGPLPEHSVRGLAAGLCRALGDIHAAGLVHRDLKPSNVLVTIDGPRVIDFGIVRALDAASTAGLTSTGVVIGSPGFMAPEQVRGERLTGAADVFALGAVLAFAATGRLPFHAPEGGPHALMYRVVNEPPDLSGVPEPLLGLIGDCLAKDPADRPTLAELGERQETRYRSLTPWLPPELLARLGREAVRLLDQEDPRTGAAGPAVDAAARTGTARPPTAPLTAAVPPSPPPPRDSSGTARRLLVHERHGAAYDTSHYGVYAMLALFTVVSLVSLIDHFTGLADAGEANATGTGGDLRPVRQSDFAVTTVVVQGILGAALVVAWLVWSAHVRAVAERLRPGGLRYPPRMAVLGWFIPVADLFLPKQIANDIWHASGPAGRMPPAGPLHTWWSLWVVTFLTWPCYWIPWTEAVSWEREGTERCLSGETEAFPLCDTAIDHTYWYEFEFTYWISLAGHLLVLPAAIATAVYVRRLTAMQRAALRNR
ncbi:protein kinase [Streptomyces sp. RFCAC02]|uniref:protein kinase domain-containing protein n=1 Tax=Streptomyces sp. RFCAC02 TaxID=2499143 RepID=UPI00143CCF02|nr:protein kinase [Streptomyces sp. RFCAC02]